MEKSYSKKYLLGRKEFGKRIVGKTAITIYDKSVVLP